MLGKAIPKIGNRVDELVGNIQKKLYEREGGERVRGENRREGLAYVFKLSVDLRRKDDSSVTHVSSLGFFNADGVPFQNAIHSSHRQRLLFLLLFS
jgi:hypothetical protein